MVQLAPSSVGGFASDECSRHLEREEIFVRSLRVVLWSENPTNILHLGISNKNSDQLHYLLQGDIQVRHIMPCHAMIDWSYIWPPYFIIGFPDKWWQMESPPIVEVLNPKKPVFCWNIAGFSCAISIIAYQMSIFPLEALEALHLFPSKKSPPCYHLLHWLIMGVFHGYNGYNGYHHLGRTRQIRAAWRVRSRPAPPATSAVGGQPPWTSNPMIMAHDGQKTRKIIVFLEKKTGFMETW